MIYLDLMIGMEEIEMEESQVEKRGSLWRREKI